MKSLGKKIKAAMYKFIWGQEVELGDCIFYTVLTLVLIGLIWLFTFERIGLPLYFSLLPWAYIVYLIWKEYKTTRNTDTKSIGLKKEE